MPESIARNTYLAIFASPRAAFASLKERPRFLWALLLLLAGTGVVQFLYMGRVDIAWFYDQQLAQSPNLTEAQIQQTTQLLANVPQVVLAVVACMGGALSVAIVMLVQALYFKIVSAIAHDNLRYKSLFCLVCWAALPSLLSNLVQIVHLLASDVSQMAPTEVNPLAFWSILGIEPLGSGTFDTIVMSYDPMAIWSLVLLVLGYRIFSGRHWATATLIALLPTLVVLGVAMTF